jgi:hypothetical protein
MSQEELLVFLKSLRGLASRAGETIEWADLDNKVKKLEAEIEKGKKHGK